MSKIIIAFGHQKHVGKDTACEFLVNVHNFKRVSFADPLKNITGALTGLDTSNFNDQSLKELPLPQYPVAIADEASVRMLAPFKTSLVVDNEQYFWTPRALLQYIGSAMRTISPDYWVNTAINEISKQKGRLFCISDLRYKNEAEALKRAFPDDKVVMVKISRPGLAESTQQSEIDLKGYAFDYELVNNTTKEEFETAIDQLVQDITK